MRARFIVMDGIDVKRYRHIGMRVDLKQTELSVYAFICFYAQKYMHRLMSVLEGHTTGTPRRAYIYAEVYVNSTEVNVLWPAAV